MTGILTDQRRPDTHCPHCDSTNLFVSTMTEGGYLCLDCRYGFVDQRKS
jgi:transposase-like protein